MAAERGCHGLYCLVSDVISVNSYLTDPEISTVDVEAKRLGVGLWQGSDPVAPRDYRARPQPNFKGAD